MAKDLTIRLLGRPQVTKDDQVGYHKVTRQYVIEGDRAEYAQINDPENPLFLPVGTEDEEFVGHYLVDQKINPAQGSVNKAYLVRVFAELRDTYVQETVQASNDLRRVRRTYVVLRAQHPFGYGAASWANHPQNPLNVSDHTYEPWEYAPSVIVSPDSPSYKTSEFTVNGKIPTFDSPQDDTTAHQSVYQTLIGFSEFNNALWIKGGAQVSMSQPGVDVWSVEWITHSNSYLSSGIKRTGSASFKPPNVVYLDHNGLDIRDFSSAGGSGTSQLRQVSSHVAFFVAEQVPDGLLNYWGGSTNFSPSVMLDFYLEGFQHNNGFNQHRLMRNTVYQINTDDFIRFPKKGGNTSSSNDSVEVADKNPGGIIFKGSFLDTVKQTETYPIDGGSESVPEYDSSQLPHFKGKPIIHAGGKISWNRPLVVLLNYATLIGVSVTPIAASSDKNDLRKIWRVVTHYAG